MLLEQAVTADVVNVTQHLAEILWLGPRAVVITVGYLQQQLPFAGTLRVEIQHHRRRHQLVTKTRNEHYWAPHRRHFLSAHELQFKNEKI